MQILSKQRRKKLQKINQTSPRFYSNKIIGGDLPWDKQEEIMEAVWKYKKVVVRSGHGIGKTWTAARLALCFPHIYCPSKVITTAPTNRQVKDLLWSEIGKQYNRSKTPLLGRLLETNLKIAKDWFVTGFATKKDTLIDDVNKFTGYHSPHLLLIFDEGAGVHPQIYTAAEGLMTSGHCRWLVIGNPGPPTGKFFEINTSPQWKSIQVSCLDSPNVRQYGKFGNLEADVALLKHLYHTEPKAPVRPELVTVEWILDRYEEWGYNHPSFQARVLGQFPQEGTDSLIPLSWIKGSEKKAFKPGQRVLAVDVARFGDNDTVFILIEGNKERIIENVHGKDTMEVAGRTLAMHKQWHPHLLVIDDLGVGGGVMDRLIEQGLEPIGFNAGGKAVEETIYENQRAEAWWLLRNDLNPAKGDLILKEHPKQTNEVASIKYKYLSTGRIKIESKQEMRKKGISSPDYGDALMMANWGRHQLGTMEIHKEIMDHYEDFSRDIPDRTATMQSMEGW